MSQPQAPRDKVSLPRAVARWSAILLALAAASPARAQSVDPLTSVRSVESVLVDAIARAEGAVVAISRVDAPMTQRAGDPFDPFAPTEPQTPAPPVGGVLDATQFGSGVVVASPEQPQARFVLTTCHVVFGDRQPQRDRTVQVAIRLPELGTVTAPAIPFAADRRIDLAVLKLDLEQAGIRPDDVPTLPIGEADGLRRGRFVIALGNPYAMARDGVSSASIGIVSNIARRPQRPAPEGVPPDRTSIHDYGTLLTVDTRLQLGASGGALLNLDGQLIGITTSLAALEGYEKSAGYAIPLDFGTRRIIAHLLNGQEADYGFLGISPEQTSRVDADGRRTSCVRAALVATDSPAFQVDLRTNDLIIQINGQPVHDVPDLMRIIGLLGSGAEAPLTVLRAGEDQPLTLTPRLGKWPVYDDRDLLSTNPRYAPWRGMTIDYPTARQRFLSSDRLEQYRRAVVVMSVEPESPAAAAGLMSGDFISKVDGVGVQSPAEFLAAVEGKSAAVEFQLWDGTTVRIGP
jgi:serine protease Do